MPTPILHRLLLEEPSVDDAEENAAVDAFVLRKIPRVEPTQRSAVPLQRGDFLANRRCREVFEQVVVLVQTVSSRDGGVAPREVIEVAVHESSEPRRLQCLRPATRSHQSKAGRSERGTQDARARRHPKRQEESFSREAGKKRRHECSAATGPGKTLRPRQQRPNLSRQCAAHSWAAAFSSALLS